MEDVGNVDLMRELLEEGPHDLIHALLPGGLDGVPILRAFFVLESHVILLSEVQRQLGPLIVDYALQVVNLRLQFFNLLYLSDLHISHVPIFNLKSSMFVLDLIQMLHLLYAALLLILFGAVGALKLLFEISLLL